MAGYFTPELMAMAICHHHPEWEAEQVAEVVVGMFQVLLGASSVNQQWVAHPAFHEMTLEPVKPRAITHNKGIATCGWCKKSHSIEQIKTCRWEANRIRPEVFEAAKHAALSTASKLKGTRND